MFVGRNSCMSQSNQLSLSDGDDDASFRRTVLSSSFSGQATQNSIHTYGSKSGHGKARKNAYTLMRTDPRGKTVWGGLCTRTYVQDTQTLIVN